MVTYELSEVNECFHTCFWTRPVWTHPWHGMHINTTQQRDVRMAAANYSKFMDSCFLFLPEEQLVNLTAAPLLRLIKVQRGLWKIFNTPVKTHIRTTHSVQCFKGPFAVNWFQWENSPLHTWQRCFYQQLYELKHFSLSLFNIREKTHLQYTTRVFIDITSYKNTLHNCFKSYSTYTVHRVYQGVIIW